MELQEGQRVFEAVLSRSQGELPHLAAGSLIQVTGVCEVELVASLAAGKTDWENPSMASLQISLRSPRDVVLLGGPPWWTWKEAAALIGMLLTVLMGALLGIYLLRRRLERQQAAQLAFSRQIIQSQERERHRIAANLHDSLGQNLLVIKNQARLAMQPVVNESVLLQRLNEISGMASQAIEEVRQITHDLRPYQLDRLGLTQAIRGILRRVSENCPIVFANHVDEIDGLFDNESEINIYRIVQEGVNNVVKHSGATEATVVVKKQASIVSISIRDNGRGFEMGLTNPGESPGAGFGLTGVSERARILGGKIVLDSQPGKGVSLTVEIPLPNPQNETGSQTADRG
jgi:signal transduction histidine kinase